jgi:hypothetical protein
MIYVKHEDGKGTYAKVWAIEDNKGFIKGRVSTSSKTQDGDWENDNWFVAFSKNCSEKAKGLQEGDSIFIKTLWFKNPYSKAHNKSFLNITIHDFDLVKNKDNSGSPAKTPEGKFPKPQVPKVEPKMQPVVEEEDKLPFDL